MRDDRRAAGATRSTSSCAVSATATATACTSARTFATTRRSPAARPSRGRSRPRSTTTSPTSAGSSRSSTSSPSDLPTSSPSAGSAAARSGSRSASTTGRRSPACTRSRRRPTTRTLIAATAREPAALLRAAAPGAAARCPGRRVRRARRGRAGEPGGAQPAARRLSLAPIPLGRSEIDSTSSPTSSSSTFLARSPWLTIPISRGRRSPAAAGPCAPSSS